MIHLNSLLIVKVIPPPDYNMKPLGIKYSSGISQNCCYKNVRFWTIIMSIFITLLCNTESSSALQTNSKEEQKQSTKLNNRPKHINLENQTYKLNPKQHQQHQSIGLSHDYLDDDGDSPKDNMIEHSHDTNSPGGSSDIDYTSDHHRIIPSLPHTQHGDNNNHDEDLSSQDDILEPLHHASSSDDLDQTRLIYEMENNNRLAGQPEKEFLTNSLAEQTCNLDRGCQRKDRLNNTFLAYCTRHRLEWLFSNDVIDSIMHSSSHVCTQVLDEFIRLDEQINKFHESFITLLQRYNCHNGYSVKWTCNDCKVSSLLQI